MPGSPFLHASAIRFQPRRPAVRRASLGLSRSGITYHRPRADRRTVASIDVLRCQTSQFCFPELGRLAAHRARQPSLPLGLPRARRA